MDQALEVKPRASCGKLVLDSLASFVYYSCPAQGERLSNRLAGGRSVSRFAADFGIRRPQAVGTSFR